MSTTSIMIVGVGGQGTLLASKILGRVLLSRGYDVKLSEVHGMSQRGGSVVTYVRFGEKVYSPIVDAGEADYILSFEALEAARWIGYLKKGGTLITNTQRTYPMPVITGAMAYPEDIPEKLAAKANVIALDALSMAMEAGSPKAVNLVLIGVLSALTPIPEEIWLEAIEATVPARFLDMNKTAFAMGRARAQVSR
jgi:indolepyruvate ferredoxin oxidoreductase beta subunit